MIELPPPQSLGWTDGLVVGLYLIATLGLGIWVARRASGSLENFFLSGRSLPWWLAGTSMVATSYASDTPLLVSGWTRAGGIAGNWRWWAYLVGTLLTVVVFSRLWRRAGVLTDVEFMELRYAGRPARFLRGFKGVYQVLFLHCFVLGWVLLAMTKVLLVLLDLGTEPVFTLGSWELTPAWLVMLGCVVIAFIYAEVAGLWGVVLTDFIQFVVALAGAVVLMFSVGDAFGGFGGLADAITALPDGERLLDHGAPLQGGSPWAWSRESWEFAIYMGAMWFMWKNTDGNGVMVQRWLASKDERHSFLASLWYAVAFFAVRPWPWIVVALASLVVLPPLRLESPVEGRVSAVTAEVITVTAADGREHGLAVPDAGHTDWVALTRVAPGDDVTQGQVLASPDDEAAYPVMMVRFLPAGLLGLMIASFLAAFMSTVDTHLNVASAYVVNDVYKRFVDPEADERRLLRVARVVGALVLLLGVAFAAASGSLRDMFDDFSKLFAGVGFVHLLRWFWWRINAWSEISALLTSAAATLTLGLWPELGTWVLPPGLIKGGAPVFAGEVVLVVAASFLVTIPVTLMTPAVNREHLARFVDRVRPVGAWGPVDKPAGYAPLGAFGWLRLLVAWGASTLLVLGCLFLPASLLLERGKGAWTWGLLALGGALVLAWSLPPLGSKARGRGPAAPGG